MRPIYALAVMPLLAACGQQAEDAGTNEYWTTPVDNGVAADPAPAPVASAPAPLTPPAPGEPGGLDNDTTPISEGPIAEESAQGAGLVVQSYYALLETGRYRQAWALWRDKGRASGMSPQAFAGSFDRYSEYHANIGAPGRVEAGAGQRHVTVPVQVYGRLEQGNRPFNMRGSVTLQRTDVDGASPEQRSWRIRSIDMKPVPAEPAPSPTPTEDNRSTARYRCMDGSRLVARFDPDKDRVTVSRGGQRLATLRGQPTGSGIHYAGGGYDLRGKAYDISWSAPGQPPIACTAIR
jgi:hypothetical protein